MSTSPSIGINGFGIIGRQTFRELADRGELERIQMINDLKAKNRDVIVTLLAHDDPYRWTHNDISFRDGVLEVDGHEIPLYHHANPVEIPWDAMDIDLVLETSGVFRNKEQVKGHRTDGNKRQVLISAPADGEVDATITFGVNEDDLGPNDRVVSAASCTTMCAATILKALINGGVDIESGYLKTIHSYTNDQSIQPNAAHSDARRARAVDGAMIDTSTGAGKALQEVLPELEATIKASAMRVDAQAVSKVILDLCLKKPISTPEALKDILRIRTNRFLGVEERPYINKDFIGDRRSAIVDMPFLDLTGKQIHIEAWYDNVAGYCARYVDLALRMLDLE